MESTGSRNHGLGRFFEVSVEGLDPTLAAEDVAFDVLVGAVSRSRLSWAWGQLELAFASGGQAFLQSGLGAAREIASGQELDAYEGLVCVAYGPLFVARTERRLPTDDEKRQTFNNLHTLLAEYKAFFDMTDEQIASLYTHKKWTSPATYARSNIQGRAGEAVVCYLSLHSAVAHNGVPVYLSSHREDNPTSDKARQLYHDKKHDAHSYHPDHPSDRTTLSIKTKRMHVPAHTEEARRVDLLQLSTELFRALEHTSLTPPDWRTTDVLEITQVLDLLIKAERPDTPYQAFAMQFRNILSQKVQNLIVAGQEYG